MTMRSLRRVRDSAPRYVRRPPVPVRDATIEPDPGPVPEIVFDRVTGPFVCRRSATMPGFDEET